MATTGAHRVDPVKVVIAGPFGAGKTTFIRTISEITIVSTDRTISDDAGHEGKDETTVAIDFGRITIADDLILYLFGTPGQARFDFMWEVASQGMLGFILIVDYDRPDSFREAIAILDFFQGLQSAPFVVAVNKGAGNPTEREIVANAIGMDDVSRVLSVDALDRESVKHALVGFLEFVLNAMEQPVAV